MNKISKQLIKIAKEIMTAKAIPDQEYRKLFQQKFKSLNYKFLCVQTINKRKYIKYECPIHGTQQMRCDLISNAQFGCKCQALSRRMPLEIFKELGAKVHHNKYNYDKVKYNNLHEKVIITCPIHGDFQQRACSHIFDHMGCMRCYQDTLS